MPFETPTLPDLANRTARAFRASLKGSDAMLWPNNLAVSAKVMAGAVWESFSFLNYISRQIFAATADTPFLERHAYEFGVSRLAASYAEGSALLAGDAGVAIPAGLVLARADGELYDVTAGGITNGAGEATVPVRAQKAGKAGNAAAGVALVLTAAFPRVSSAGEAAAGGIGLGADTESDESLRARVLFRKRMPPHGGAVHDYVAWMRELNGVTRVFVDPITATNGRNSVGVWFLMDDTYLNGVPQEADVIRAAAHIDGLRPAGAIVSVTAPAPVVVNVAVAGLSPDTAVVRDAVKAEVTDLFRAARVSTYTTPFVLYRSKIVEAISIASGEDHHTLTTPAADVTFAPGQLPVIGTISYT